jgi:putative flavoprotein involved in K+ transport
MNAGLDRREVIVIGGGQAGLALGHHLVHQRRRFTILDAGDSPAAVWRSRWDSLTLFTPARYDGLPGRPFPGDADHYPTRDEVVDYLTDYARDFELPVELNTRVRAVQARKRDYLVETDDRTYEADQVVIATGPFQTPRIPAIATDLAAEVRQHHSSDYHRPTTSQTVPCSWSGAATPAFRSRTSSPQRTRSTSPSAHDKRRSLSGCSGATSSQSSPRPG